MNQVTFGTRTFTIPDNGLEYDNEKLIVRILLKGTEIKELENLLKEGTDSIDIYDPISYGIVATFKGYTEISSIAKEYDQHIDEDTVEDIGTIVLKKTSLEKYIAQNTEDITILSDAIAELAEIIGG